MDQISGLNPPPQRRDYMCAHQLPRHQALALRGQPLLHAAAHQQRVHLLLRHGWHLFILHATRMHKSRNC